MKLLLLKLNYFFSSFNISTILLFKSESFISVVSIMISLISFIGFNISFSIFIDELNPSSLYKGCFLLVSLYLFISISSLASRKIIKGFIPFLLISFIISGKFISKSFSLISRVIATLFTFEIPFLKISTNFSIKFNGRLSIQKYPISSRNSEALVLPAPEIPVMITKFLFFPSHKF